ncbi:MAG: M14 family metallopeptidase [Planctomycetes bacterium]|nr:M14 family metallopeptidase [Planctomycetota bacterium]
MKRCMAAVAAALSMCSCAGPQRFPEPKTVAERTGYKETSRHADVLAFIEELRARTDLVRVESIGRSALGQDMPALILTRAPSGAPVPVVLIIANIHAGEVEGKEVSLMLARDLALGDAEGLLDRMILLIVPNYNPDGNDAIAPENRKLDLKNLSGQVGPEGGVGTRYTGEGINLNRDYMKMEAVESRHLSRFFGKWRPHLTMDLHTTDGSLHRYALTYDTAHNPQSGPEGPIRYVFDRLLPAVSQAVKSKTGFDMFYYGDFREETNPEAGWQTYSPLPRYGSNYRGLLGRMDVLSEAYSYIPFERRADATYAFVLEVLRYVAAHGGEIMSIVEDAERDILRRGLDPAPDDWVAINYGVAKHAGDRLLFDFPVQPRAGEVTLLSWDRPSLKERRIEGAKPEDYRTRYYADFVPSVKVRRPFAYAFPAEAQALAAKLREHNVRVERLTEEVEIDIEAYAVRRIEKTFSRDAGSGERFETVVTVEPNHTRRRLSRDEFVVRTAQPLGNVAIYLLEPQSDDGLARWNFFDAALQVDKEFPVVRIPGRVELPSVGR